MYWWRRNYDLILNQNLYNFEDSILNLNDKTDNLRCNALTLFDKFENKEIIINVDNLNSDHFFENFKKKFTTSFQDFFDQVEDNLILKGDVVEINKNIYIPPGLRVIIKPGQNIILTDKAFIISFLEYRGAGGLL